MSKPAILVTRAVFPEVLARLQTHFVVSDNQSDVPLTPAELKQRCANMDAVLTTGADRVDAALLEACPRLKICANVAVGHNNLDLDAMTARGVLATNTPDVLTETVADFGFALLLATARRVAESERFLRRGEWTKWALDFFSGSEVHGTTLGVLGMGRIGQGVARRGAHGFGMNVLYHNRTRLPEDVEAGCKARYVSKEELLRACDHLVIVMPYTPAAHHTIGAAELALMKPTATLVNIARGGIVDDVALAAALKAGRLAAAGLDVFEREPAVCAELLELPNAVLTPHIASSTRRTRLAMANLAADNAINYITAGTALTPLNPAVMRAPRD